jgi:hypothetical protein
VTVVLGLRGVRRGARFRSQLGCRLEGISLDWGRRGRAAVVAPGGGSGAPLVIGLVCIRRCRTRVQHVDGAGGRGQR